jgi:hypothetical protein
MIPILPYMLPIIFPSFIVMLLLILKNIAIIIATAALRSNLNVNVASEADVQAQLTMQMMK